MYDEDNATFQLPTESKTTTVADVIETATAKQPAQLTHSFLRTEKLSDQALFDELNAVSEEVIKCRDQILNKIS